MRLIIYRDQPVEEIAAEPATLHQFAALLARARTARTGGGRVAGTTGLHGLPLIEDIDIPPLTVLLRPHTTPETT